MVAIRDESEGSVLGPYEFTIDLTPSPSSIRVARQNVEGWARRVGADQIVETAALLVSELATNAVLHVGEDYRVVGYWQPPAFRVEVLDSAPHVRARRAHPDERTVGGRGLAIVDSIADAWGVERRGSQKAVWFVLNVGPRGDAYSR